MSESENTNVQEQLETGSQPMSNGMKPTVYFATDHAGYELKNELVSFVRDELQLDVTDFGAFHHDADDDFPDFIAQAAKAVAEKPTHKAIILGGSGQGEAMVANRFPGVRATVYYGEPTKEQVDADGASLGIISSSRLHNDANVLSLGARFISTEDAKKVVAEWLATEFTSEERHVRRIKKIDQVCKP